MADTNPKKTYKIGEVARQMDVAVETIRVYEREGILLTEKSSTGQRIFNDNDIHWISCIRRLIREQGMNMEGIRRLLALMPCWEWRPCSEEERNSCQAVRSGEGPCWTMRHCVPESCRGQNCRECNVYQNAIRCENLKPRLFEMMEARGPVH